MGLLDSFDDPNTVGLLSLGSGLLSASGPSRMPVSLGQVLGQGMNQSLQAYQASRKLQEDRAKEKLQMDMLAQQIAQATRKNTLINDMLQRFGGAGGNGGDPSAALAAGAQQGDLGPTNTNAARLASAPGGQDGGDLYQGVPRAAIASDLAFNDGKHIGEWQFKQGTPDMQVSNGYAYDRQQLRPGFLPSLNVSQNGQSTVVTVDPKTGMPVVSAPAGALATYNDYRQADERARARYDTMTVTPANSGPMLTTRARIVDGMDGGAGQAGDLPTGAFTGSSARIEAQIQRIADPAERAAALAAYKRQVSGEQGQPQALGMPLQTDAAKARGTATAEKVVNLIDGTYNAATGAADSMDASNRLLQALDSGKVLYGPGSTWSTIGKQIATKAGFGGKDVEEQLANTRAAMQALAEFSLNARQQLKGQGAITDSEQAVVQRARGGNIDTMTMPEMKLLATVAQRQAARLYQQHQTNLSTMRSDPAQAGNAEYYANVPVLPAPYGLPPEKSATSQSQAPRIRKYNPATGKIE